MKAQIPKTKTKIGTPSLEDFSGLSSADYIDMTQGLFPAPCPPYIFKLEDMNLFNIPCQIVFILSLPFLSNLLGSFFFFFNINHVPKYVSVSLTQKIP